MSAEFHPGSAPVDRTAPTTTAGGSGRFEDLLEQDRATDHATLVRKRLHLWLPLLVTAGVLVLVGLIAGLGHLVSLAVTAVVSFFAAGKFIILTGAGAHHLNPWELAAMVFYMDVLVAFLLAYNMDVFYRIPRMGPNLSRLQDYGRYTLEEKPYLRKISFAGLVIFVLFPVAATGAIGGSIFGRLMGMRPYRIVLGIGMGSAIGCGLLAWGTKAIESAAEQIKDDPWFKLGGLVVVALLVLFLWLRYRAVERHIEARRRSREETGST
jgi:uncharacterized membrane protein